MASLCFDTCSSSHGEWLVCSSYGKWQLKWEKGKILKGSPKAMAVLQ